MRTVLVLLRDTTEADVTAYLDGAYPPQREPWVVPVNGDACLYVGLYHDGPREHEPHEWTEIVGRFGDEPAVAVIAEVSGRHPGDKQVAEFVAGLLTRFNGAAMDEYTTYLWSVDEVRGGYRVAGHVFFDYKGWFAKSAS